MSNVPGTYTTTQDFTPQRPIKVAVSSDSTGTVTALVLFGSGLSKSTQIGQLSANQSAEIDVSGEALRLSVTGSVTYEVF